MLVCIYSDNFRNLFLKIYIYVWELYFDVICHLDECIVIIKYGNNLSFFFLSQRPKFYFPQASCLQSILQVQPSVWVYNNVPLQLHSHAETHRKRAIQSVCLSVSLLIYVCMYIKIKSACVSIKKKKCMGYAHTQYFPLAGLRWVSGLNIFDKGRQGDEYQTLCIQQLPRSSMTLQIPFIILPTSDSPFLFMANSFFPSLLLLGHETTWDMRFVFFSPFLFFVCILSHIR